MQSRTSHPLYITSKPPDSLSCITSRPLRWEREVVPKRWFSYRKLTTHGTNPKPFKQHYNPGGSLQSHFQTNVVIHLSLGLPSGLLPLDFLAKTLYAFLLSPTCATGRSSHPAWHHYRNSKRLCVQIMKLFNVLYLQPPSVSFLSSPNTFFSILFLSTLRQSTSLSVKYKVSHCI
jgi:hypothetical protein